MSRIAETFRKLKQNGSGAFMPFVTAGDPNLATTADLLRGLDRAGCHLCEIGFPFSDPIADGPVIQESFNRALAGGVRVGGIFEMVQAVSGELTMPLVAMVSYSIVFRQGLAGFVRQAADAGFAGLIVPDLPVQESEGLATACRERGLDLIQLITPTTSHERARQIVESASGFIYYVSVAGVTGERRSLPTDLADNIAWLRTLTELPICVGFGVGEPEQARQLSAISDGVIVGSAIVRRMEQLSGTPAEDGEGISELAAWCGEFVRAVKRSGRAGPDAGTPG